jgi:transglutaminase-like putative cysteine protease
MFERISERYRQINKKQPAENSIFARAMVLAAVLTGTAAVIAQGYFSLSTSILAPAGIIAGSVLSWYRRENINIGLKIFLSFALLAVSTWFFYSMAVEPYDTRVPLAELFLWIQVMHSFDVPARRDLRFSLAAGLVLISMAGTLALDATFIIYLALFMVFALAAMFGMHLSEIGVDIRDFARKVSFRQAAIPFIGISLAFILISSAAYLVTPRLPGMRVQSLPFSAEKLLQSAYKGGLIGAGSVNLDRSLPMSRARFSGKAYPGFNEQLDLRVRGRLSEDLMMRVKSTNTVYHRGMVFDTYTGKGWKQTAEKPSKTMKAGRPPIILPVRDTEGSVGARETTSSYYIEADQPNIVFAPYQPALLYFPAAAVWVDKDSAMTSSFSLDQGLVYSVVSRYDPPNPTRLGKVPAIYKDRDFTPYLQLPKVPKRLSDYAVAVTKTEAKPYGKLIAIQNALEGRCAYDLEAPFQKETQDSIDFFIFESKRGSCDQFASAFVVMARLNSIPARLVTGFAPGDYNPFTGYWEVRAEHAHSWAEAYIPFYGWIAFDPTPGFAVPDSGANTTSMAATKISDYLKANFGPQLKLIRNTALAAKTALFSPAGLAAAAGAIVLYFLVFVGLPLARRRRLKAEEPMSVGGPAEEIYAEMLETYREAGLARAAQQTPSEFAAGLDDSAAGDEAAKITVFFEDSYYGGKNPSAERINEARETLSSLIRRLKQSPG